MVDYLTADGGPFGCCHRSLNALRVEIMAWLMLAAAGLLEVVWAYAMKLSDGFTRPLYSIVTFVGVLPYSQRQCAHYRWERPIPSGLGKGQ